MWRRSPRGAGPLSWPTWLHSRWTKGLDKAQTSQIRSNQAQSQCSKVKPHWVAAEKRMYSSFIHATPAGVFVRVMWKAYSLFVPSCSVLLEIVWSLLKAKRQMASQTATVTAAWNSCTSMITIVQLTGGPGAKKALTSRRAARWDWTR